MNNYQLDVEDLILEMANVVREVRFLREENHELKQELHERNQWLKESYKRSQQGASEALRFAISNINIKGE